MAHLIEQLILIRVLEEELQKLCDVGEAGALHFNRGQEAIAVGAMAALRDTDYVVTHHRAIAHAVAKGIPLEPLVGELLGKPCGLNAGIAGEMQFSSPEHRFMSSFQLVGTCVPVAAGLAWAVKNYTKTDDIVVVFHGDAATANGQWHEGMNLAAVQQVPLLVICENNGLAGNVRAEKYLPVVDVVERARSYGIGYSQVDGNDVEAVRSAVEYACNELVAWGRPHFLECKTTRLGKHKQGMGDLRAPEEMDRLKLLDPLRDVPEADYAEARERVHSVLATVRGNMN